MPSNDLQWNRLPIRELYLGLYDGPHATPKPTDSGPVFLGIGNITEDGHLDLNNVRHISENEFPTWTRRVTPEAGDIVFTYEATLNRYAIIPKGFRGCLGRRLALIRPNPATVDTRFLYYYFFGADWRATIANNMLAGATVDRIPLTRFPDFPIYTPPLPIQRRIASILSAYDDLIENNTRRIAILEEMARRIYEEWFVKFKFPGHEKVKMVDSELGKIPDGWKIQTLGEYTFITMGQSPKSEFYNQDGNGLPFHQGVTDFGRHFPIHRMYCTAQARIAEFGDILMSVRAPVGRINLAPSKMVIGRGLCAMRSKSGQQRFLLHLLLEKFREEDSMGNGAIFKAVTKEEVYGICFPLPSLNFLNQFETIVEPFWGRIENLTKKNANLRSTRDFLVPKLISGEIDVSKLPEPEEAAA